MATFLFDEIVFGPVKSRRLGVSLGINLLPTKKKSAISIASIANADGHRILKKLSAIFPVGKWFIMLLNANYQR